eukprot:1753751-Amphidinium_carterae.1
MAVITDVTSEEEQPQAFATTTKTPMFLDPVGKAYALADSGATNVTLNLKHLGKKKVDATPVEMTLASGKVAAYIEMNLTRKAFDETPVEGGTTLLDRDAVCRHQTRIA